MGVEPNVLELPFCTVVVASGQVGGGAQNWSICLDPSPGGPAKPITLRDKRPAYGSNSWLPRHKLASPLIFDP